MQQKSKKVRPVFGFKEIKEMVQPRNAQVEAEGRFTPSSNPPNNGGAECLSDLSAKQRFASAKTGSTRALGELFDGCRNYLLLIANQAVNQGLQAKVGGSDLVQETFIEAHRIFERFEGESEEELLRWLTRILEFKIGNTLKRYFGTESRDVRRELDWSQFLRSDLSLSMASSCQSPSGEIQVQEEKEKFSRAMANLTIEQQNVVKLRIDNRLSFEAIGEKTNRSADAARKMFMRAVESFQQDLIPNHDERETTNATQRGGRT